MRATQDSLANPFYRAVRRSVVARYAVYLANVASMLLMARAFLPATFGAVAAVTVIVTFFQMMSEAGLGPAIINLDQLSASDRNGLFGLTVTAGIALAGILLMATPVFVDFYRIPRIGEVVPYVSGALLFYSMSVVPNALLLREQSFFQLGVAGLIAEVLSTGTSIGLLSVCDPLHALASKSLVSSFATFALAFHFSRNTEFGQPRIGAKFGAIRPLLSFSSYQFGFNCINYCSRNLDNILVGRFLGAGMLGIYDKAYQLMRYPLTLLSFAMTPALQPAIKRHAGDPEGAEAIHRDFAKKLSMLGALAGLGIYLMADKIVLILLGNAWQGSIPVIKVLAIAVPVQVVFSTIGSFFQAMNRADLLFVSGLVNGVVMVVAISIGVSTGDLVKLSWALVAAFHVNFIVSYYMLYRMVFRTRPATFFVSMVPAAVVVGLMVAPFHA